jgi:hypothetical protein
LASVPRIDTTIGASLAARMPSQAAAQRQACMTSTASGAFSAARAAASAAVISSHRASAATACPAASKPALSLRAATLLPRAAARSLGRQIRIRTSPSMHTRAAPSERLDPTRQSGDIRNTGTN